MQIQIAQSSIGAEEDTIMVYMWGDQRFYLEIPLKFEVVTPTMQCDPSEVKINFCFINFKYDRKIKLINMSKLSGKVAYTPTKVSKNTVKFC